jgi:hypothetical protein
LFLWSHSGHPTAPNLRMHTIVLITEDGRNMYGRSEDNIAHTLPLQRSRTESMDAAEQLALPSSAAAPGDRLSSRQYLEASTRRPEDVRRTLQRINRAATVTWRAYRAVYTSTVDIVHGCTAVIAVFSWPTVVKRMQRNAGPGGQIAQKMRRPHSAHY